MTINVETGDAGTYPDVDETQLRSLSDNLAEGSVYLIVHDSTRGREYAQAAGNPQDKYAIEYYDDAGYHYQTKVDTTAEVGNFLSAWAWQREGWKDGYSWTELDYLRGA